MKILFGLTYYRPHISGLTMTTQRLAEGLAAKGHEVTIITSMYQEDLLPEEFIAGVRVIRAASAFRLSKGVIMPSYPVLLKPLIEGCDIGIINLPCTPIESVFFPMLFRLSGKPSIAILHCDLKLPSGFVNRIIDTVVFACSWLAGSLTNAIVTYTDDYAHHAPLMRCFPKKRMGIAPPVVVKLSEKSELEKFQLDHAPAGEVLIGFPCRFASEKGVEILLNALSSIRRKIPRAKVIFAGENKNVIGEESYIARLMPSIKALGTEQWEFIGVIAPEKMSIFFAACAVIVLPSLNRTESFGLVQVESMLCGTPVIASDLPGVRVPVRRTGMGKIVTPGDAIALGEAIIEVIQNRENFQRPYSLINREFSLEKSVGEYENLLQKLVSSNS